MTTLRGSARDLYGRIYYARSKMENRIKEQQLDLFAGRTSCHAWWPNQLRRLISTLAHVLVEGLRRLALRGTEWAQRQAAKLRAPVSSRSARW